MDMLIHININMLIQLTYTWLHQLDKKVNHIQNNLFFIHADTQTCSGCQVTQLFGAVEAPDSRESAELMALVTDDFSSNKTQKLYSSLEKPAKSKQARLPALADVFNIPRSNKTRA